MANFNPPFNAQERDIDLLLLEEIHCSPEFVSWVAQHLGIGSATLISARHSVYKDNGETDVLAVFDSNDGHVAVMIEDKIGAAMQPKQAERYHMRGEKLCATEPTIKSYKTLLCAPRAYLTSVPVTDWHATLPLEDIAEWFAKQEGPRSEWRRNILTNAVRRQRRSIAGADTTNVKTDPALIEFKRNYYEHVVANYPDFRAAQQPGRDREFHFKGVNFPSYISLKHQFGRSEMVLMFEKQWIKTASNVLSKSLSDEDMWITPQPLSLHLAVGIEPIDFTQSFIDQVDLIDLALESARRLLPYASMVQQAPAL